MIQSLSGYFYLVDDILKQSMNDLSSPILVCTCFFCCFFPQKYNIHKHASSILKRIQLEVILICSVNLSDHPIFLLDHPPPPLSPQG